MITSASNPQIKNMIQLQKKAKARWQQRVFVVEGPKMVLEAPREWVERVYVSESYLRRLREAVQKEKSAVGEGFGGVESRRDVVGAAGEVFSGRESRRDAAGAAGEGFGGRENLKVLGELERIGYEIVSDSVLKAVSDTQTPQGILALVRMPEYGLRDLMSPAPSLLVLESIQDPGNLGTMLRTGEGAGISGVIMNKSTVDIFSPKVVRATMGSLYRVPFYIAEDFAQTIGELKRQGVSVYAAHLKGEKSYDKPDYTKGTAFLVGNEGNGLTEEAAKLADMYIRIPMEGQVESLNAAIAATLLMYEAYRQRRG